MQNKAVHIVTVQMIQRAGDRLRDLGGEPGCGIVREAMILTTCVGEFGLEKEIGAGHESGIVGGGESFTDSGLAETEFGAAPRMVLTLS